MHLSPQRSSNSVNLFTRPIHTYLKLESVNEGTVFISDTANTISSQVTPGITALEYAQRRSKLAAKLPKNAVAILAASEIKYRSGAVFYEFHQESNFFYLTGKKIH